MPRAKPVRPDQLAEPIWFLRSLPYGEYVTSIWWRRRKQRYLDLIIQKRGELECEACFWAFDRNPVHPRAHVHHLTYEHLGDEADEDLMLLCSLCHNAVHFPDSHAAQHWTNWYFEKKGHDLAAKLAMYLPEVPA